MGYRQQVLEAKQQAYSEAQGRAMEQEQVVFDLEDEYREFDDGFSLKKASGMTVVEAMGCENCLRTLETSIKNQRIELKRLQLEAEQKRQEMISAKQDASSTEKLREKKLELYKHEQTKAEEAIIDELVAASWSMSRQKAN